MRKYLVAGAIAALLTGPAMAADVRPDPNLTPGSVQYNAPALICGHATEHRRAMTNARRDEVLTRYKLPAGPHPDYEIDHLIPLCLGGSDDVSNLWPQPRRSIEPKWTAEAKERLERTLCNLVCDQLLDLSDAQEMIAKDWLRAYYLYVE